MKKDLNEFEFLKGNLAVNGQAYVDERFSFEKEDSDSSQTQQAFNVKWDALKEESKNDQEAWKVFQKDWYLKLYGFESEDSLKSFLSDKSLIIDAGCGKGYKAAWFARLSPDSIVLGIDISTSILEASRRYSEIENLYFIQSDIAQMPLVDECVDFISCDQVIHHTQDPSSTLAEFRRLLKNERFLCNYVYAKKALPRELLDEYFRTAVHGLEEKQLWSLSDKLTDLGRMLSELNITLDFPDIKELGIKGGPQDLQRFIYWNFIKCFWNEELGREASVSSNFDWYAPSIAYRYSLDEFLTMSKTAGFEQVYLHQEEACHSGLFKAI
jgi:SAM-dependent methyltransferase